MLISSFIYKIIQLHYVLEFTVQSYNAISLPRKGLPTLSGFSMHFPTPLQSAQKLLRGAPVAKLNVIKHVHLPNSNFPFTKLKKKSRTSRFDSMCCFQWPKAFLQLHSVWKLKTLRAKWATTKKNQNEEYYNFHA